MDPNEKRMPGTWTKQKLEFRYPPGMDTTCVWVVHVHKRTNPVGLIPWKSIVRDQKNK